MPHLSLKRCKLCWGHLNRGLAAHADSLGVEKKFGEPGLQVCVRVVWTSEVFEHTGDQGA